jgi:membrane-associated phospholipid phosphatase
LREVLDVAANLNAEQKRIALFWVDGHGSVTPAGHWNQIAINEVIGSTFDDLKVAQLFAYLNVAMADSFIAAWDAKYHYWTGRPISVAELLYGEVLSPALLTPPFPSYVSGHAAFSGAASRVLGRFLPLKAERLKVMAEEAALSRLYGGIHFRHDNEDGLVLGQKIAEKLLQRYSLEGVAKVQTRDGFFASLRANKE